MRQVKSYTALLHDAFPQAQHIQMHVIALPDDPLIDQMRAEWPHTWAWGKQFPVVNTEAQDDE